MAEELKVTNNWLERLKSTLQLNPVSTILSEDYGKQIDDVLLEIIKSITDTNLIQIKKLTSSEDFIKFVYSSNDIANPYTGLQNLKSTYDRVYEQHKYLTDIYVQENKTATY